jgi:hypothetical protein
VPGGVVEAIELDVHEELFKAISVKGHVNLKHNLIW